MKLIVTADAPQVSIAVQRGDPPHLWFTIEGANENLGHLWLTIEEAEAVRADLDKAIQKANHRLSHV